MAAITYYTYQDNRKNGTNLWYAKVFPHATVDLKYVAQRIEQNCSMKQSDVLAYLTELIEVIGFRLKQGYKVQMGDLGYFSIGLCSKGSVTEKDFSVAEFVKGTRINYQTKNTRSDGVTTRAVLNDVNFVKVERATSNA